MDKKLLRIINSIDDGILLVNKKRDVTFENESARKIFKSSLLGMNIEKAIPSSRMKKSLEDIFEKKEAEDFRLVIYKQYIGNNAYLHGKGRELNYNIHLVRNSSNEAVVMLRNVTKEERLAMVRQDFISNASHELKTPLTAIVGFSETISEERLSEDEMKYFAKIIHKNSTHMEHILSDLLLLTSLDRSEVLPTMEKTDIRKIISEVISYTLYKAQSKNITIEMQSDQLEVLCNSSLIVQALINLVVNAINYSNENSKVEIASWKKDANAYISVRDQGCGIAHEDQVRIFERFYRVDKARSRASGGTGLGLAIVRHIAILHGGTITVESELGKGAVFTLRLPLK